MTFLEAFGQSNGLTSCVGSINFAALCAAGSYVYFVHPLGPGHMRSFFELFILTVIYNVFLGEFKKASSGLRTQLTLQTSPRVARPVLFIISCELMSLFGIWISRSCINVWHP